MVFWWPGPLWANGVGGPWKSGISIAISAPKGHSPATRVSVSPRGETASSEMGSESGSKRDPNPYQVLVSQVHV